LCDTVETCTSTKPCVLRAVKSPWLKAGFSTIEDRSIVNRIHRIDEKWVKMNKNKNKKTKAFLDSQNEYSEELKGLFNIAVKDIEDKISMDRIRDTSSKEEDLVFWKDQQYPKLRKMVIGQKDSLYEKQIIKNIPDYNKI